jgi:GT2 family glycosyltransferase
MKPLVSILLPHLRAPENDKALRIALDTLVTHTALNYELLLESVEERRDYYTVLNDMAAKAQADWILPTNTDVFYSAHWLESLYEARDFNTIVSPVMVEPGAIPVNDRNFHRDFGRTPETFQRTAFEAWVQAGGGWRDDWKDGGQAWYHPSLYSRQAFLDMGGFDTSLGSFPAPLDMDYHERWQAHGGTFKRVRSWVYHLQAFSSGRGER